LQVLAIYLHSPTQRATTPQFWRVLSLLDFIPSWNSFAF